jgi:nitrate reductase gamma subunit
MRTKLLFDAFPYVAAALFAAGLVGRVILALRGRGVVGASRGASRATSRIGQAFAALVVAVHAVVLALPAQVLAWDVDPTRLYALEGIAFVAGVGALVAWCLSVGRHLARHPAPAGELVDSVFLSLVAVGLVSGLAMAAGYRWASSWGAATLAPYVWSIPSGAPRAEYVGSVPFLVQLHVFSAFAALALAPFTTTAAAIVERSVVLLRRPHTAHAPTLAER